MCFSISGATMTRQEAINRLLIHEQNEWLAKHMQIDYDPRRLGYAQDDLRMDLLSDELSQLVDGMKPTTIVES